MPLDDRADVCAGAVVKLPDRQFELPPADGQRRAPR
jgi:hypothetical protein